jgi:uncharacterized membrane protein
MEIQSFAHVPDRASQEEVNSLAPLFSAVLRPHRSLTPNRIRTMIGLVALAGFFAAIPFIVMGFWPVAGFYGLDIALLYWAFRYNMRDAEAFEEITLSALNLSIRKVDPQGRERFWSFTPLWTRLERDLGSDQEIRHLRLVCRGITLTIAECLSHEDRQDFGDSLSLALRDARKGPVFQNSF